MTAILKALAIGAAITVMAGCAQHKVQAAEETGEPAPEGPGRPELSTSAPLDCGAIIGNKSSVLLIAINKGGQARAYRCEFEFNGKPTAPGKPVKKLPDGVSNMPVRGNTVVYEKYPNEHGDPGGDPCISLGSGGSKVYYCW